jgi:hypothetical protein
MLSGLADRLPRRTVMIVCDLSRAVLVVIMALPGLPLALRVAPLFVVTLISAPFSSARSAVRSLASSAFAPRCWRTRPPTWARP